MPAGGSHRSVLTRFSEPAVVNRDAFAGSTVFCGYGVDTRMTHRASEAGLLGVMATNPMSRLSVLGPENTSRTAAAIELLGAGVRPGSVRPGGAQGTVNGAVWGRGRSGD